MQLWGHYAGKITCENLCLCSALIYSDLQGSDLRYKHKDRIASAGGGRGGGQGRRDEGTRGQKTAGLGGRALSAARSHDNTPEKKETTEAATILTVPLQTLR